MLKICWDQIKRKVRTQPCLNERYRPQQIQIDNIVPRDHLLLFHFSFREQAIKIETNEPI